MRRAASNRRRKQQARLHHRTTGTDRARADQIQRRQRGRHVNRRDRTAATGTDHLQLRAESRQHHHAGTHRRHRLHRRARPRDLLRRHHGKPAKRPAIRQKHVQRTRIRIRQHRTIPSIQPNRILPRNIHGQRQSRQRGIRDNHHQRAPKSTLPTRLRQHLQTSRRKSQPAKKSKSRSP